MARVMGIVDRMYMSKMGEEVRSHQHPQSSSRVN